MQKITKQDAIDTLTESLYFHTKLCTAIIEKKLPIDDEVIQFTTLTKIEEANEKIREIIYKVENYC